ncbi:MAG: transglycosylase SLT domain-containing protein [Syntrophorhabdales bacterium]
MKYFVITHVVVLLLLIILGVYLQRMFVPEPKVVILPFKTVEGSQPMQQYSCSHVRHILRRLGAPRKEINDLGSAIHLASVRTGIDEKLLSVLMHTESSFQHKAQSEAGYGGLMQTPTSSGFTDVDVLHEADILKKKLEMAHGDILKALTFYKGGGKMAAEQASEVIKIYDNLD